MLRRVLPSVKIGLKATPSQFPRISSRYLRAPDSTSDCALPRFDGKEPTFSHGIGDSGQSGLLVSRV